VVGATAASTWGIPPERPALQADDLHIWRASLEASAEVIKEMEAILTPGERARAERFKFPGGRERYVAGRATLRRLLGRYLEEAPESITFEHGKYGKPYLSGGAALHFNMSDSQDVAVFALALGREVGVDIERIRQETHCEKIARRHFTPGEYMEMMALPKINLRECFFHMWARKEAFVKAIGMGLYAPLNAFEVTVWPKTPVAVHVLMPLEASAGRWSLAEITPEEGYCAAVAIQGTPPRITCWRWS